MTKRLRAVFFTLVMVLSLGSVFTVMAYETGYKDAYIDETVDKSITHVTGVIHITGSGGTQAGYNPEQTVYGPTEQKSSCESPKTAGIQNSINDAYNKVRFLSEQCMNKGKSGEYQMSSKLVNYIPWDNRVSSIEYTVTDGPGITAPVSVSEKAEDVYEDAGGNTYTPDSYQITRTQIDSGDYGYEYFYLVAANGEVDGYDIAISKAGNGTATAQPAASLSGETVLLTAVPADGYKFKKWEVVSGGTVLSDETAASASFVMPAADVEVKAVFEVQTEAPSQTPTDTPTDTSGGTETDLWGNKRVSEAGSVAEGQMEQSILALSNDNDPAYSTFGLLQAKARKTTNSSVTVTWKRVDGAVSYTVFGNRCGKGNKYQKLAAVSGAQYVHKKLKKGTYYKFLVVANGGGKAIAVSKTIHAATAGGKAGNDKAVKIAGSKTLSLKEGKTSKIQAKAVAKSKKLKVKTHRKLAFETDDPNVATVNRNGVIKAVGKGRCTIYVYAQDGVSAQVKVNVN